MHFREKKLRATMRPTMQIKNMLYMRHRTNQKTRLHRVAHYIYSIECNVVDVKDMVHDR